MKTKNEMRFPKKFRIVKDFLPPPDKLLIPEAEVKVTLSLTKRSVQFFKQMARKNGGKYQRMIRRVLDYYSFKNAA